MRDIRIVSSERGHQPPEPGARTLGQCKGRGLTLMGAGKNGQTLPKKGENRRRGRETEEQSKVPKETRRVSEVGSPPSKETIYEKGHKTKYPMKRGRTTRKRRGVLNYFFPTKREHTPGEGKGVQKRSRKERETRSDKR